MKVRSQAPVHHLAPRPPRARRRSGAILGVAAWLALTWVTIGLWQQRHNTLESNGSWITSKSELEVGTIGGVMFRVTRPALHRNRLDLSAWFGHQEVVLEQPVEGCATVAFRFRVDEGAHLTLLFDGVGLGTEEEGFRGLRLSRHPVFPSALLRMNGKRLFSANQPLEPSPPIEDGWHEAVFRRGAEDYRLWLNGHPVARGPLPAAPARQRVGFRGGTVRVLVDDVAVAGADGRRLFDEGFAGRRPALGVAAAVGGAAAVLLAAILVLVRRRPRRAPPSFYVTTVAAAAALAIGTVWGVDYRWLSARYPADVLHVPGYRNAMFDRGEVDALPATHALRVVFAGSSQTFGCGARWQEDRWTRRVEQLFNAQHPEHPISCINLGVSGDRVADAVARMHRRLPGLAPDVVVINFGHNDPNTHAFATALLEFIQLNRKLGARTMLMLEPNGIEPPVFTGGNPRRLDNHAVMRHVAEVGQLTVLDAQAAMDAAADRGFLWWDAVHQTSGGQEVMARFVAGELGRHLGRGD